MNIGRYAPSGQFTFIALSLLLSGGLVYGAERLSNLPPSTLTVKTDGASTQPSDSANWQATLDSIQAQNASTALTPPDGTTVQAMLQAAQSANITDSVGRTMLVNLSNAKSQGLGDDIPTQDQIVAAATAQIAATKPAVVYTSADLNIVPDSDASLKAYGNGVIQVLIDHPLASETATLTAIGNATNKNSAAELASLPTIKSAYLGIVTDLLDVPVPKTLSPLHLSIIKGYAAIAATFPDMQATITDPLRGIVGMQVFEQQLDQVSRVFTNIAENLNKDGILFTKSEPGSVWQTFLTSP